MHEVLVNRLGGLSLPRKSVVRLTDRPDMTLDVYRGRKTTTKQNKTIGSFQFKSFLTSTSPAFSKSCKTNVKKASVKFWEDLFYYQHFMQILSLPKIGDSHHLNEFHIK